MYMCTRTNFAFVSIVVLASLGALNEREKFQGPQNSRQTRACVRSCVCVYMRVFVGVCVCVCVCVLCVCVTNMIYSIAPTHTPAFTHTPAPTHPHKSVCGDEFCVNT